MKKLFSFNYGRLEYYYNENAMFIQALLLIAMLTFTFLTLVVPGVASAQWRHSILGWLIGASCIGLLASIALHYRDNRRGVKIYHVKTHGEKIAWLRGFTGSEVDFKKYCRIHLKESQELIAMSALRSSTGLIMAIAKPGRHHHCFLIEHKEACMEYVSGFNQGFLTNQGRFVGRKEALRIARNGGQLFGRRKTGYADELCSEDLW